MSSYVSFVPMAEGSALRRRCFSPHSTALPLERKASLWQKFLSGSSAPTTLVSACVSTSVQKTDVSLRSSPISSSIARSQQNRYSCISRESVSSGLVLAIMVRPDQGPGQASERGERRSFILSAFQAFTAQTGASGHPHTSYGVRVVVGSRAFTLAMPLLGLAVSWCGLSTLPESSELTSRTMTA